MWSQTVCSSQSCDIYRLYGLEKLSEPQFYHLWSEANKSTLLGGQFWEISEVMYVNCFAWGWAHGRCSVSAGHFWGCCCCWGNVTGAQWSQKAYDKGDSLFWLVQDGSSSQVVGLSVLKPGEEGCTGHSNAHLRPQSSVQSDLITYAV